jgi:probable phosphoglycerate mutase
VTELRYVVEADGGARGNPGPAAYGAVVLVDDLPIRHLAGALGHATNNVAEYSGLVAALEWISGESGETPQARVDVRMDSRLVVEQMSGRWKIKHPAMRTLASTARSAYPPELVRYSWVPRERNRRADALVNEVLDAGLAEGETIDRAP